MFTSSVGGRDYEIIDYLVEGPKKGKQIVLYGHSRGGAAAVRIANKLGDMYIHVAKVNLYDPVEMYGGGDFVFTHPYVMKLIIITKESQLIIYILLFVLKWQIIPLKEVQ